MKLCPKCNMQLEDSAAFCPNCGTQFIPNATVTQQPYVPVDSADHTAEFDSADIRENKLFAAICYVASFLGRMLFSGDDVFKSVKVLSGGEKVRCMLSRMMLSGANFLVLDQPTNHLDLESIAALNNGLEAFKYNILFSCHDHQLTQTVANRIIEITEDGVIDRLCSYDEYMHISDLEQAR